MPPCATAVDVRLIRDLCRMSTRFKGVRPMTRKAAARVVVVALAALALALVPAAFGKGKPGGGGGGGSCTHKTPAVVVDNTWAWAAPGSYGLPGQQLTYAIDVVNYDTGCSGSSFVVGVSAPSGFSVSLPTNTIKLSSGSSG